MGIVVLALLLAVGGTAIAAKIHATRVLTEYGQQPGPMPPMPTAQSSSDSPQPTATATTPSPTSSTSPTSPTSPTSSASPTASAPSASTSATRPANPGGTASEKKPDYRSTGSGAENNKVYNTVFEAGSLGCSGIPLRKPPIPDKDLKGYAQQIVGCLTSQLKGPVAKQGYTLTTPKVQTYARDLDTPCGFIALERYPAFYCSFNQTIYLNALTDDTNFGYYGAEIGYWMILTHEFGHHVQYVSGIFPEYTKRYRAGSTSEQLALTRRLELQATCFGGVELNTMWTSLKLGPSDYAQMDFFNSNYDDRARDHGSGPNNKRWFDRGYSGDWSSFGDCNTWAAKDSTVS